MTFERNLEHLREMEDMFSELWQGRRLVGPGRAFRPAVDVYRAQEPPAVVVVVDLAGVDPADVDLTVADGALAISGHRRRPAPSGAVCQQLELDYGAFERHIPLDQDVDTDAARASYERGLLTIVLPLLAKPPRSRKVTIAVARRP